MLSTCYTVTCTMFTAIQSTNPTGTTMELVPHAILVSPLLHGLQPIRSESMGRTSQHSTSKWEYLAPGTTSQISLSQLPLTSHSTPQEIKSLLLTASQLGTVQKDLMWRAFLQPPSNKTILFLIWDGSLLLRLRSHKPLSVSLSQKALPLLRTTYPWMSRSSMVSTLGNHL
jgi:hypothetical protein